MGQELLNRGVKPHGTLWGASALYNKKYHSTIVKHIWILLKLVLK